MKKFISHVQVPVNNLDDSIDWYVKFLGGTLAANFGVFAIIEFNEGPNINLWKTNDNTTSTFTVDGEPFPTIGIEVENIDHVITSIKESGSDYEGAGQPTLDEEGRKFFRFFDPTGNMIVVHEEPK
ncbi:VOC family protein [Paenibacillaceae bacterium]|nr:VOC family protein [Paenibacillaceae bacterium]